MTMVSGFVTVGGVDGVPCIVEPATSMPERGPGGSEVEGSFHKRRTFVFVPQPAAEAAQPGTKILYNGETYDVIRNRTRPNGYIAVTGNVPILVT